MAAPGTEINPQILLRRLIFVLGRTQDNAEFQLPGGRNNRLQI